MFRRWIIGLLLASLLSVDALAAQWLRLGTATTVDLGPFQDSSGVVQIALTVPNMTVKVSKHSDTFSSTVTSFSPTASGGSHDCQLRGILYNCELTSSDVDTLGRLTITVTIAGALVVFHEYEVIAAASYDSNVVGSILTLADVYGYPTSNLTIAGSVGKQSVDQGVQLSTLATQASVDGLPTAVATGSGTFTGTAQAGGNNTITLAASDLAADSNAYQYGIITLTGGTGIGQKALITAFNASTKVATILNQTTSSGNWTTNPDSTTIYAIIPGRR